ncbi:hypothetical protein ACVOMV_26420 (plasmid) [Mesorhizobium atlanticum]|uniref:hypothetical protein n=1 Tax=Mesorhizobium atlanticum TaxID=2233532 RepID=UPI003704245A
MSYYFSKTIGMPFAAAVCRVTNKPASKGFGRLTTIHAQQTMKANLGVEFKPYTILGIASGGHRHSRYPERAARARRWTFD